MKKLSSLSAYDGVFSGGGGGAPATYSSRIEDYKEIFRGSSSSIPILDLSALDGAADVAGARGSSKKLDYSKIFGGVRDDDVAESYEEVFAKRTPTKTASSSDGSARSGSQKEEEYQRGTHKQYNTFYNRASQASKDGVNGTTHVAQIRAVPGFTCFIDENIQKGNNSGPLLKDKTLPNPQVSVDLNKKQTTVGTETIKRQTSWDTFYSVDRSVDAKGSSVETNSSKLSSPNRVPASSASYKKRSGELNFKVPNSGLLKTDPGDGSPTSSDEDLDVNAAALRRAVREAEASIRLAKEIMERNKNGFQKFSKPRSKEGLEMKKKKVEKASVPVTRTEIVAPNFQEIEEVGIANEGVRETNGANNNSHDDGQALITKLERKKTRKACKIASSFEKSDEVKSVVENISGKGNEDKLEISADSKAPQCFPELLKAADKPKTTTLELENIGSNIMQLFRNVFGKGNEDKVEASADSKAPQQLPELLKTDEPKTETFEAEYTNGSNIRPFLQDVFGKGNEDKLEASADSKAPQQLPELLETDDRKTETFEAEHTNGSNIRPFLQDVSKLVNEEKSETSADSEALGQFPEPVKTENQRNAALEMGNTSGCNIMSVHNVSGKVNEEMVETSGDSEGPGQFPKLVKENLKTGHTNSNNIIPSVPNLSGKVKEDKLELSAVSKVLGQFPELASAEKQKNANWGLGDTNGTSTMPTHHNVSGKENEDKLELMRAENQIDANLELGFTDGNSTMRSFHDLSGKEDEDKLELSAESEQFPELVETDYLRTTTLELEQTNGSNSSRLFIQNISEKVNEEKLEAFADSESLGEFPELGKTDRRTAVLDLEHRNDSNISMAIQNVHTKANEDKLEQSADFEVPQQPPDLLKTENQGIASLDLRHNNGSNVMPSGHTSEGGETKKPIDEGTLDLPEEGYSKETHRKRKQWKDFEGKASDIRIAEDTEQCVRDTTVQEVHGHGEKTLEPVEERKEIHRKRRQWKDALVKPDDIKIADIGEIYVREQETKEKATDVQDKGKTSSSKESCEEESVKSQEHVKEDFVSSNAKSNHSEELNEAQKGVEIEKIKECFKEPENAETLKGVYEEKESVEHMCKQDEIEKKLQESSEWTDYEVAFEPESNMNGTRDAWKEDGSEHLGDCLETQGDKGDDNNISSEGSEKMSDASQSSFDFKEDFDFDEEVGETSEIYQSCEFDYETGRIRTCTESLIFNDTLENVDSSDEDIGARQTQLVGNHSQLVNNTSTGTKAALQMHEENEDFDFEKQVDMEFGAEASRPPNLFKSEEARGVYEQESVTMRNMKEAAQAPNVLQGEEKTAEESWRKEVKADELSKREKEREKNRKVVERAIREARERAFAEARERAERAAVEKATAEARERVMAEARQKFEKTNTSAKPPTEKASLQAKLRSERAAVERANAEARERALEKALSQKASFSSSKMDGNNGESAERRNARLEKTQKTMERAAKALAEKNMRDLRAQREQAERHRLAETLDAEIKRWSSGKTGNLRALLSTLQYILGPDSGWQPVSLTELITASAVKKAYRKATLHVHPDKLQQRGASIQQKYICEKVFDLLKAAWNRFNSEER